MIEPAMRYHADLMGRCLQLLRSPDQAKPKLKSPRVTLASLREVPAFDDMTAWLITQEPKPQRLHIRRLRIFRQATWDQIRPLLLYNPDLVPNPIVEIADGYAPTSTWETLQSCADQLRIPPFPAAPQIYGLDGTTWTLRLGTYMAQSEFQWWHDHPPEWEPLRNWAAQLIRVCTEIVESGSPEN